MEFQLNAVYRKLAACRTLVRAFFRSTKTASANEVSCPTGCSTALRAEKKAKKWNFLRHEVPI